MPAPSTHWREAIAPDEEQRFERQGRRLAAVQAARNRRYGLGRLLHRKPILALKGSLEVLPGLPEPARHGLFTEPRRFPARVRLSNGGFDVAPDSTPDIRGFSIKVLDVDGPAALGGAASSQDFLLVNQSAFSARTSDEFVDVVVAASQGTATLLWTMARRYGIGGALAHLAALRRTLSRPFSGFAGETFDSLAPIAVGPYAARVRLAPATPGPAAGDLAADIRARLAGGPLVYILSLQFFTDEATTPIEDPTKVWPEASAPLLAVARLTLEAVADDVEPLRFDPWGGLTAHRPLGEIMRARKAAYFLSQKARGAV